MAREFPADFQTPAPIAYGHDQPVDNAIETTIAKNINWLYGNVIPPLILDMFGESSGGLSLFTTLDPAVGYDTGDPKVFASYRIKVPKDFATYRIKVRLQNTHATATGALTVALASNAASVSATIPANATNTISVDLAINTGTARETIVLGALNPNPDSGGVVKVQSVSVYPVPLSSPIAAGVAASGFIPIDTVDTASNRPLSIHLRNTELASIKAIYDKRAGGAAVTFSQGKTERTTANWSYRTDSAAYVHKIRVPLWVPPGFSLLEWSAQGYTLGGTLSGKIKIVTEAEPAGKESAAFGSSWTVAGVNTGAFQDNATGGSSTEVAVVGGQWHTLDVYLKSNGTHYTQLAGLCVWLKER